MGFLLQKLEGEVACAENLANCEALLRRLHLLGLILMSMAIRTSKIPLSIYRISGSGVRLVDFELVEKLAQTNILSMPAELLEDTRRGATVSL